MRGQPECANPVAARSRSVRTNLAAHFIAARGEAPDAAMSGQTDASLVREKLGGLDPADRRCVVDAWALKFARTLRLDFTSPCGFAHDIYQQAL